MRSFQLQLCGLSAVALLAAQALALWYGAPYPVIPRSMLIVVLGLSAMGATAGLVLYVLWLAVIEREPSPIPRVRAVTGRYLSPAFAVQRLGPMLATFLVLGTFGTFKSLIPEFNPFAWDTALSDLDRIVLGTDAWRLTHAVIGPAGTRAIDFLYGLWFAEWAVAVACFSLFAGFATQRRFFVSFIALWIVLGVVLALVFSSAGPVFLDLIGHPYADRYLIPLDDAPAAAAARAFLESGYASGSMGVGNGISAMPSMHVAVAALIALAAPKGWRVLAWAYCAVIMLGSVHLGWHYASDGVAGALGAWAIWSASSRSPKSTARRRC